MMHFVAKTGVWKFVKFASSSQYGSLLLSAHLFVFPKSKVRKANIIGFINGLGLQTLIH